MVRDLYITKLHNLNSKFGLEHSNKSNNPNKTKKFNSKARKPRKVNVRLWYIAANLMGLF